MSAASTAILVKSRSKFGRRLTTKDYDELLSCRNILDITNFLKANTHYGSVLESIRESAVHRGNLESLLKQKMYNDFARLCSFERSIGEHYFEYLLLRSEIDQLLLFLRYFTAGTPEKFIFNLPDFFKNSTKFNIEGLTQAKSYDDILQAIKSTKYHDLLIPFKPDEGKNPDFTIIESVLDRYMYEFTDNMVARHFKGEERRELQRIFGIQGELINIRKAYRAKRYYNTSGDVIKSMFNGEAIYLNRRITEQIIAAEKSDDILEILKKTRYRHYLSKIEYSYIDDLANRVLYDYCRRKMHFSKHAAVVMASAIVLSEIEIENITNVIEGKRYEVDADTIRKLLILD